MCCTLGTVVLFGIFAVAKKFGVDSLQRNISLSLDLLDSIGVSLVRIVVRASVLLL